MSHRGISEGNHRLIINGNDGDINGYFLGVILTIKDRVGKKVTSCMVLVWQVFQIGCLPQKGSMLRCLLNFID